MSSKKKHLKSPGLTAVPVQVRPRAPRYPFDFKDYFIRNADNALNIVYAGLRQSRRIVDKLNTEHLSNSSKKSLANLSKNQTSTQELIQQYNLLKTPAQKSLVLFGLVLIQISEELNRPPSKLELLLKYIDRFHDPKLVAAYLTKEISETGEVLENPESDRVEFE